MLRAHDLAMPIRLGHCGCPRMCYASTPPGRLPHLVHSGLGTGQPSRPAGLIGSPVLGRLGSRLSGVDPERAELAVVDP
jgi:hypothetical protein